jgi:predicted nucleic-acid-binding Zn-ribbon protein
MEGDAMAKDLEAQARIRENTIERKLADIQKRKFYQRECRKLTGKDERIQHQAEFYGAGLRAGVFLVPMGGEPDWIDGIGAVCPKCFEDQAEIEAARIPKVKPKKIRQ